MIKPQAGDIIVFVALHPEGVDRNYKEENNDGWYCVALHPEGVDRNIYNDTTELMEQMSPSTRRAWIEI